ncbi:hypothetical protein [Ruegeria sp. 6PALISEP08]|uniref:hypothetical protein n=1 Tax=Ruegeria sp. 6PALISEP08 TaxID=1225660 RepID=UPI00067F5893|nr:hypothetical protein [Ruegeria sp. 6PALISEP08]
MELIANILLVAGALGAGLYCFVLARRLKRFTDLEKGVGVAVAVLSTQAEELRKSLEDARRVSDQSGDQLKALTQRAEAVAQRLELTMASMHDVIPEENPTPEAIETALPDTQPEGPKTIGQDDTAEVADSSLPDVEEEEIKAPEGLMFFRHDRKQGEAQA